MGEVGVTAPRATVLSNAFCHEILTALEGVYAAEGPDEPDLGLNIAYATSRRSLCRLARAEPWEVPHDAVESIRHMLADVAAIRDREALDAQLLSFPGRVLHLLDRRRNRGQPQGLIHSRRAGDERPDSTAAGSGGYR